MSTAAKFRAVEAPAEVSRSQAPRSFPRLLKEAATWERPQLAKLFQEVHTVSHVGEVKVATLERCQLLDLCLETMQTLPYKEVIERYDSLNYSSDSLTKYLKTKIDD